MRPTSMRRSRPEKGVQVRLEVAHGAARPHEAVLLSSFAKLIEDNALEFALLDTTDMGKPISEMLNIDIPGAATTFNYFGELIDKIRWPGHRDRGDRVPSSTSCASR